jgi:hypothetical protein
VITKSNHGFTRRAYRNVPLNGVTSFSVLVTKKSEIANLHSHIYMSKSIQKQFRLNKVVAMKLELRIIGA